MSRRPLYLDKKQLSLFTKLVKVCEKCGRVFAPQSHKVKRCAYCCKKVTPW